MAPRGRPKKKVEVAESKLAVKDAIADEVIKSKKIGVVGKAPKKGRELQSSDVGNEMNGSREAEEPQTEVAQSDVPTNEKVASKRQQKPAKTKGKEESAEDEKMEEISDVKEEEKSKDLPAKRGRRAAEDIKKDESSDANEEDKPKDIPAKRGRRAAEYIKKDESSDANEEDKSKDLPVKRGKRAAKIENGVHLAEDGETKDLPRSRRNVKADVESSNSVKEQNNLEPKETKAKSGKKANMQIKENSVEKNIPTKVAGRKRKNAFEKTEPEKIEDEIPPKVDENRQLKVALERNRNLDEMARQQRENDAEDFEEPKVKNVKGPAKGKGKRAAKDTTEVSQPTKKTKEDAKSKGASKKEKIPDVTALDFSNESKTAVGKPWNLKIATWNVNGLRAWLEKNGMSYLHHEKPDILCVQETKCSDDKLPPELVKVDGYHCYWLAGDKEGYSGVGLLSKEEPISVKYGIDIEEHDKEGRVITAEYDEFYLVTTYIPNAGRGLIRLDYRQEWDKAFLAYIKKLDEKKPVVLCGDLNVAHEEIDLANPKSNKKTAGFTKEEREGFSTLLSEGFVDTFRHLYPDKTGAYTFWTYMMNSRAKNVGWRLDYFVISKRFADRLCDNVIRKDVFGSDHCPIALFLHV